MSNGNPTTPGDLYFESYGAGDPLLCLHGFGASLYSWRNFKNTQLATDYNLILLDLKGAGKSPKPPDSHYSTQDHADLIYGFIQLKNLQKLTLIGNSFGGALSLLVSLMLLERDPGRLRRLVLIDPGAYKKYIPGYLKILSVPIINSAVIYLTPARCAAKSVLKKSYYDPKKITDEQIDAYAAPIAAPGGKHALLETGKQIIPPNIDEINAKYPNISVPTQIIWGEDDQVINPIVGDLLKAAIKNSDLKHVSQCGHVPQEERPEITVPMVLDFLKTHPI